MTPSFTTEVIEGTPTSTGDCPHYLVVLTCTAAEHGGGGLNYPRTYLA